jgi:hypothetical protein
MPSIRDTLWSEPSGGRHALVMFAGALLFTVAYAYSASRGVASDWVLFLIVGNTLSGIAESLPTERRRVAGLLRVAAILVLLGLLAAIAVAPEFVLGN